jgi:predicted nucleic acid-binding protein
VTAPFSSPVYVLDSFAILALIREEPGATRVREILLRADAVEVRLAMAVVNLGEVFYRTAREEGSSRAEEMLLVIHHYAIELFEVDRALAIAGAELKSRYRMAYADCIAAALALRLGATVMTGDPEFEQVEGVVEIEWLPRAT